MERARNCLNVMIVSRAHLKAGSRQDMVPTTMPNTPNWMLVVVARTKSGSVRTNCKKPCV